MDKNIDFGPVADLYDAHVRWDGDVPFFRQICAGAEGEVLELMCGTGRLSIPLLEAGHRLSCVDYSAEMLAVLSQKLRDRGLHAEVREGDVRELNLGRRFGLILLPFHSFSEILDPGDRALALRRIRQHLAPGGRFVLSLHNPAVRIPALDGERRRLGEVPIPGREGILRVHFTARYHPETGLAEALQEYEIFDAEGQRLERRELRLRFGLPDRAGFEAQAAEAGFEVLRLWGDYAFSPFHPETSPHMIWELGGLAPLS